MEGPQAWPLPEDPVLAEVAVAMEAARQWGEIVDRDWRVVYVTDDFRRSMGVLIERAPMPIGEHYFGTAAMAVRSAWRVGPNAPEFSRPVFQALGGWVVGDTAGGHDVVRETVDPSLRDLVGELPDGDARSAITYAGPGIGIQGRSIDVLCTAVRIRDAGGRLAGTATFLKPAAGMSVLGALGAFGDLEHFERMQQVVRPARRPAAILFADLEGSTPLARQLSTASFFSLSRRLVRATDACIIDAGGIVGRHVGDGVVAFFLAEVVGGESAAARACITAARAVRLEAAGVAEHSGLTAGDVVLRFGLHWGSTLYVGQMSTRGRAEVTAMGDEVNETSRIEACAAGGRALASKALIERLDQADAAALGLDPDRMSYVRLADLQTASDKARRDAPAIAVCDV